MEELFRSGDLLVRRVPGAGDGDRTCAVVTFDSFTDWRTLDRPGFGQGVLHDAGIDAVHVVSRDNHWFQYPEVPEAMARVRAAMQGYGRVVAYGSSMGAYAALRLAGLVGADTVLALSPQFSISRRVAPWEHRWRYNTDAFRDVWEGALPFPQPARAYVVYDPLDLDRRHVERYAAAMPVVRVPVRGAGHPATGALVEMGLLKGLLLSVCRGTFDGAAFVAAAEARRGRSAHMLMCEAERIGGWRLARRIALLRQARALAPRDAVVLSRLGVALRRAGWFEEALAMHRESHGVLPDNATLLLQYAVTLGASGDWDGAARMADEVVALAQASGLYERHARAFRKRGWRARRRVRDWLWGWLAMGLRGRRG